MLYLLCNDVLNAAVPEALKVQELTLNNGLTVWLNEDHSQPKVFGAVVVKAGAKDCPDTGIAHYFEHMMFKGTDKIGTLNYEAEKVLLDSISMKYDELSKTGDEAARKSIQAEINRLSIRSSDYVIPNEFDRLISRYGGSNLNAWTSQDMTVYHNSFSPQYFRQWAELCSERIVHPVFRLFQSELETVYEEKNMYSDNLLNNAMEKVMDRFFAPHPYAYPIIGSTKNLKNPQLSQMSRFFDDYYVAGNMGLILSGDFNTSEMVPLLEKTFGRIKPGVAPKQEVPSPKPLEGAVPMNVLINIPIINACGMIWRGVPTGHPDELKLKIAMRLLNNENGTGSLDKLTSDHKLTEAVAVAYGMKEEGAVATIVLPKIPFHSNKKAKAMVMHEINRIKNGDFSEETLTSLKLEYKRNFERELENIDSRSQRMIMLLGTGKSWEDYIKDVQSIEFLTKDDLIKVANTYLNENYLSLIKKTGSYPKDKLQKPGFAPIVPPNREAKSAYAKALESVPVDTLAPRFLDFEKDVKTINLASHATLYVTQNPLNDVFTLKLNYGKGTRESRLIAPASTILNYLGTDSLSLQDFRKSLQQLGSTMSFESSPEAFTITLSGFDQQLEPTLALANQFINRVKPDKKQLKTIIDERKVVEKSERKSTDNVAEALFHKVKFGNNSDELNRFSMAELKKLKATDLVGEFKAVTQVACDMHYCGNQPVEVVAALVKKYLSPETCTIPSNNPVCFDLQPVNEPVVYLINDPKASQSIVYGYIKGEVNPDRTSRHEATLFNNYFGGSMSSLLFQEIREFRSLAYRVRAMYEPAPFIRSGQPGSLYMMLSTQCDKTIEAMGLLDSMVREMPLKAERVETCRFDMINAARNKYPDFRTISTQIASLKSNGFLSDPNKELAEAAPGMDITNISSFYDQYVKGRPIAWMIVGNSAQIDKTKLAAFGKLIELKTAAVFH